VVAAAFGDPADPAAAPEPGRRSDRTSDDLGDDRLRAAIEALTGRAAETGASRASLPTWLTDPDSDEESVGDPFAVRLFEEP
jgi:hypothetical protein